MKNNGEKPKMLHSTKDNDTVSQGECIYIYKYKKKNKIGRLKNTVSLELPRISAQNVKYKMYTNI